MYYVLPNDSDPSVHESPPPFGIFDFQRYTYSGNYVSVSTIELDNKANLIMQRVTPRAGHKYSITNYL